MPVAVSYPGVYIEEIPSGVRTITGVATSITAFLGRTRAGPANEPVTINSFADFERGFGGLAAELPLTYAVRSFYLNGGGQAIIVRLYEPPPPPTDASGEAAPDAEGGGARRTARGSAAKGNQPANGDGIARLEVDGLKLEARSPGTWGNSLRAIADVEVMDDVRKR